MVNGPVAGSGPGGPGLGQQLPAHPIQLAYMAPTETPQECPQGGWRLHRTPQHPLGPASAQRISVVNVRHRQTTRQCRRRQGQHLFASVGSDRGASQVNVALHQLAQSQMMGQRGWKDRHRAVIVEGDMGGVRPLQ